MVESDIYTFSIEFTLHFSSMHIAPNNAGFTRYSKLLRAQIANISGTALLYQDKTAWKSCIQSITLIPMAPDAHARRFATAPDIQRITTDCEKKRKVFNTCTT
jgi:hypothetical protein